MTTLSKHQSRGVEHYKGRRAITTSMPSEQQLIQTIEQFQPEMVRSCSRLIQIPSVNGVNNEIAVAEAIAAQARSLGLLTQIVGENPHRPNVIVSTAESGQTG